MLDPTGTTAYQYDNLDRLTRTTYPDTKTVQATYDRAGNRTSMTNPGGTATTATYDAGNRLTQMTQGTLTWTFGYDAAGNRTSLSHPNGTSIAYAYLTNNWLQAITDRAPAGTAFQSVSYTYDQNGNRLTQADSSGTTTFTWDVFNRLTQASGSGGTVTYTYNGDGLKTRRVGPDGTINYYYDGIRPIWETNSVGQMANQYDRDIFGNLLSRQDRTGARRYYHFDGLGSTTALTTETGAVAATLLYDAWGNQRAATGSGQGNYRFTGAELDTTTGLYHMGARFYDPTIGRWLSEDPVQDTPFQPATLNYYAYVTNNPMIFADPTGKFAIFGFLSTLFSFLHMAFPAVEWLSTASTFMGFAASAESGDIGSMVAQLIPPELERWTSKEMIAADYGEAAVHYHKAWDVFHDWRSYVKALIKSRGDPAGAFENMAQEYAIEKAAGNMFVIRAIQEDLHFYNGEVWLTPGMVTAAQKYWISKYVTWPNRPFPYGPPGYR